MEYHDAKRNPDEPVEPRATLERDYKELIRTPEKRDRMVELMRERITFTDDEIVRFAKSRLQVCTDY